ncbi:ribose-5-phosphate isomerase RpiA [Ahrensia sp. R2A130]|uniref:ribose-5-phosphate isomerase RpiA n=1 Tax=Ahrensia sp. R2A130 TaxID=744979 RepID=UPI0001E0F06D|nr:ribose-5-phosphate isomerase RpiA [Ahrensia sp. R2A130]EFL90423.1 ribose 5-phosphate isomerase A [Ahrensia sp. R2A130]
MTTMKQRAGEAALDYVSDGMKLGIGTGSTAEAFVRALAPKVADGLSIIGVPTSERTRELCEELGVPLTTLEETPHLDLTIDGADEIDPDLALIKGAGGALLREKIVAAASDRMIVIADTSKIVETLGTSFPVPIEVDRFGLASTRNAIEKAASQLGLSGDIVVRTNGDAPYITDGGHLILDASFRRIVDPERLAVALNVIPGVVEHGLFVGLADIAIVASGTGVEIVTASGGK